jgi:hypothetical protein
MIPRRTSKMIPLMSQYLNGLRFGDEQSLDDLVLIPVFSESPNGFHYLMMEDAIETNLLEVTEFNIGGSVGELRVHNTSDEFVLLLDGQELIGAKQNRVLNTSILLFPRSKVVAPVSCTEQGRWSYRSGRFSSSDYVMSPSTRLCKAMGVYQSLKKGHGHRSDQSAVWRAVASLLSSSKTASSTAASSDMYLGLENRLGKMGEVLPLCPGQMGSLVSITGIPVGMDVLSSSDAYAKVHSKLIKGYCVDSMFRAPESDALQAKFDPNHFVEMLRNCDKEAFDSVAAGCEFRIQGPGVRGFALTYENAVIHASFFTDGSARVAEEVC